MKPSARSLLFEVLLAATFAAVAGAAAYFVTQRLTPPWVAVVDYATIDDPLVARDPAAREGGGAGGEPDLAPYARAVTSDDVLRAAALALGSARGADALRRRVSADVIPVGPGADPAWTALLRIAARGADADGAAARAAAVATAFEAWDARATATRVERAAARLDEAVRIATERVRAAQVLPPEGDGAEVEALVAERQRLLDLQARLDAGEVPAASIRQVASGVREVTPPLARNTVFAALLAAATSVALGFRTPRSGRRRGRPGGGAPPAGRRTRTGGPVEARPGAPTGGDRRRDVPSLAGVPVLAAFGPGGVSADGAASLRAAVAAALGDARPRTLVVTGLRDGRGATTVATALAVASARNGGRTVLVDGDLRRPSVAAALDVRDVPDVAVTTLAGLQGSAPERVTIELDVGGDARLAVVPQMRPVRPAPGASEAMFTGLARFLSRWRAADLIVVDAAPIGEVEDTAWLARGAAGVLLVVAPSEARTSGVRPARVAIEAAGGRLVGVVVNAVAGDGRG